MAQWLRLCTATAEGSGSIPGRRTKILHAAKESQLKKKKSVEINYLLDKNVLSKTNKH